MDAWQTLPTELQLRDADLVSLSLQKVEYFFELAAKLGVLDQFTKLFWPAFERACSNPDNCSIQRCVELLEERKRTLGRCYDHSRDTIISKRFFAMQYNNCEYNIRWLTEQYNCTRTTKPYLLEE